jgi:hypothetical protein
MVSTYGAMTAERKARIWPLWRGGISMSVIARHIVKPPATVYSYLLYHGGLMPRQATRRPGCYRSRSAKRFHGDWRQG